MHPIVRRITGFLLAVLPNIMLPTYLASAQTRPTRQMRAVDPFTAYIAEASQRFGIPAAWIRAVLRAESAGDPRAVSRKGAIGLMQVMPATWTRLHARHSLGSDPCNPRDSILAGTAYLRELHDRYGSVTAMLAAYNAGSGRYEASLSGRRLPAETLAYVAAVAPVIDGRTAAGPLRLAAADPLAWTRAPLFVVQPERKPAADSMLAGRSPGDGPANIAARDLSAIAPQADGLFVSRADARDAR